MSAPTSISTSIPSGAATASVASSTTSATSRASAPPSPTASIRASVSRDSVSRLIRSASSLSLLRKCSRALGVVLGAGAQDLDRARDPRDRVAQLVRGVGDELALGDLAAKLLGAVANHGQHRLLSGQQAGGEPVDVVADPQRVVLDDRAALGAAKPRDQRLDRAAVGGDQVVGRGVGEPHLAVGRDHHHRVRERLEDRREPVALLAQGAERLASGRRASAPAPARGR